jgi:hypothetical protein
MLASRPGRLTARKASRCLLEQEARWLPEPVWTLWRNEKYLPATRIEPRFLDHPACKLVGIPTELNRNKLNSFKHSSMESQYPDKSMSVGVFSGRFTTCAYRVCLDYMQYNHVREVLALSRRYITHVSAMYQ